ncbi:hypothetical protein CRENBAI_005402 [Crenichthys baileyi]|uniref:Uncharacterized protein n=1 Tax=Crenichthys baileyi TaxID=28760 RepID=A0AAV9RMZ1_9TELE
MLPACLRSGFLRCTDPNRMIPPRMDLADEHQASSMDLFTFLSREAEKTLRSSAGLSVLRSAYDGSRLAIPCPGTGPLRRRSPPAPLAAQSGPAVKSLPSSRRKKCQRGAPSCVSAGEESLTAAAVMPGAGTPLLAGGRAAASKPASMPATAPSPRLAAPPPMPSSLAPARCSEATPDELEKRLRFFARQIKTFRKTSLLYSSPELMERIRKMEEDYGTAIRQFYCRPPPSTPGLQGAAAAAQPTPGLQGAAAAEQSTPGLQGAATAAEQSMQGLQGAAAAAEQSMSGLQPAIELSEGPEGGLPPLPGPEHLLSFLWGVLTEFKPDTHHDTPQSDTPHSDTPQPVSARSDTPQPVSARSDTPQPVSARPDTPQPDTPQPETLQPDTPQPDTPQPDTPQPDPKSASTSSTRRRGRRKRDASVHATEDLCNASAPAHASEDLGDASAPAHAIEGFGDASAPAHATEGLGDTSAPAHATEGPADASAPSLQGFSGKLVLVLASEPCDEGFEEEEPPDPVRKVPLRPLRVRQALLLPLRVRQALLLPLRVRQAFAVACPNSVPARDDLLVARLNSVPAWDDLLVARLNSVPARDDLLVARLNSVPVSGPPAMAPHRPPGSGCFLFGLLWASGIRL